MRQIQFNLQSIPASPYPPPRLRFRVAVHVALRSRARVCLAIGWNSNVGLPPPVRGRVGMVRPTAPLVEQARAVGGSECHDLQQAGYIRAIYPYQTPSRKRYMISALTPPEPACHRLGGGDVVSLRRRAPLVEQVRAVGGSECHDLQQAG
jgi:hypothetical protein